MVGLLGPVFIQTLFTATLMGHPHRDLRTETH